MSQLSKYSANKIIWLFTAISGLVAWRVMYIQHGWINNDSTLYFEMARLFSIGEWQQGWDLFKWPFYPLLIAFTHKTTGMNLHLSAQVLAVIFFCITAYSLSKLIQLAGGEKLTIICGNLLLLSSTYITGDVFGMLLRDQGFWAFFLTSLIFFIRYARTYRISDATFWQLSIITATLFRVEGIAYAFFLPFILFIQPFKWQINFNHFVKANLLHLIFMLMLLCGIYAFSTISISNLGRLNEIAALFSTNEELSISGIFAQKLEIFRKQVLGEHLEDYATFGMIITFMCVVAVKCFKVAGSLTALLVLAARKSLLNLPAKDAQIIFLATGAIAILNATVIIFRSFVLSSRYVIAFGFLFIIFAAFYLAQLAEKKLHRQTNFWQSLLLIISCVMICGGLVKNLANKRSDYNYEQDAVAWVKSKAKVTDRIHYDSARLRYYANAPWAGRNDDDEMGFFIQSIETNHREYDFLVMHAESDEHEKLHRLSSLASYHEIKRFSNKSGNQILILRNKHPD